MNDRRCNICWGVGWILEYAGGGSKDPLCLELLPCLVPDCDVSGRRIEHLSLNEAGFTRSSKNESGLVMAVGVETTWEGGA